MITTLGKLHIKRYMAGFVPAIARSMVFGIGPRAEALGDTALQFEAARAPITITSLDFVNNKIIYKAIIPEEFSGTIYEMGIFSLDSSDPAGSFGSRVLTTFDSDTEAWVDATTLLAANFNTTSMRLGADWLTLTATVSTTPSARLDELSLDLSGNSSADTFNMAVNSNNSNNTNVQVFFKTDDSNYYQYTLTGISTGYNLVTFTKGAAVVTGTPTWSNISTIQVKVVASGNNVISFDGIRIEDLDTTDPEYVLVARRVLPTPLTKVDGLTQEVEFALDISV